MQKILHFFLKLLQVAGGELNIAKYACFTVFHLWLGDKATLLKIHDWHPMMTITHPYSGELKIITNKDPSEAHRALGWMMTTDCKSTAQFLVLKHKAKIFAGAILQSRKQRYDATTACNCYYLAIISYTIAATHFSLQKFKTIQSPVLCATLNKMAIHHNKVLIQGFGATDGCIEDVSSYRAEICGNIATFTILTLIRKT
jgi:hypothetical protein